MLTATVLVLGACAAMTTPAMCGHTENLAYHTTPISNDRTTRLDDYLPIGGTSQQLEKNLKLAFRAVLHCSSAASYRIVLVAKLWQTHDSII